MWAELVEALAHALRQAQGTSWAKGTSWLRAHRGLRHTDFGLLGVVGSGLCHKVWA